MWPCTQDSAAPRSGICLNCFVAGPAVTQVIKSGGGYEDVQAAIDQLVPYNPTANPARVPELQGEWRLIWSSATAEVTKVCAHHRVRVRFCILDSLNAQPTKPSWFCFPCAVSSALDPPPCSPCFVLCCICLSEYTEFEVNGLDIFGTSSLSTAFEYVLRRVSQQSATSGLSSSFSHAKMFQQSYSRFRERAYWMSLLASRPQRFVLHILRYNFYFFFSLVILSIWGSLNQGQPVPSPLIVCYHSLRPVFLSSPLLSLLMFYSSWKNHSFFFMLLSLEYGF